MNLNLNRHQRRALAKGAGRNGMALVRDIGAAAEAVQNLGATVKEAGDLGASLADAQQLITELGGMRDELRSALSLILAKSEEQEAQLIAQQYELEKQRAVYLRFFFQHDVFLSHQDMHQRFLAEEARYRAEYDAMTSVVKLLKLLEGL